MSSSSSSPLDLLESLTIDQDMSPTSQEVRSRAIEVRDILSSFDRDILPAEFKPLIFSELDRPFQSRPPVSQWTIQEDLSATLLQWGAYDDKAYELLTSLQSGSTLARCFHEKLGRRFRMLFEEYDCLPEEYPRVRTDLARIVQQFRNIVAAVKADCPYREVGKEAVVRRLLDAMIDVCRRHADIFRAAESPTTPRRGTRRTASTSVEGPTNLFDALIKSPDEENAGSVFMLDVLEMFPSSVYVNLEAEHNNLTSLLEVNNAPSSFRYRVGRLPSRPDPASDSASASPGAAENQTKSSSSRNITVSTRSDGARDVSITSANTVSRGQTQSQPVSATGAKRSAEDSSPTARRGKKKTSK